MSLGNNAVVARGGAAPPNRRPEIPGRLRTIVRSIGPAVAIIVAQQVLFPAPAGIVMRGVIVGGLTALVALGMALVYRADRIINFAQADLGLAPTIVAFLLITESGVPYPLALAAGLVLAVATGAATERLVIRRFTRSPRLLTTIATIGLSQVLAAVALLVPEAWDVGMVSGRVDPPFDATFRVGTLLFDANDLLALVVTPVVVCLVALFLRRSDVGVAIRASADGAERAALLGVPVGRLRTIVWSLASALAFAAVFLRSGILDLPSGTALGFGLLLRVLTALLIGRMTDLVAVSAAAVSLGVLELGVQQNHGFELMDPVLGLVVVIVLVLRRRSAGGPGRAEAAAWQAAEAVRPVPAVLARLPVVRGARWAALALVALVSLALPSLLAADQVFRAAAVLIYALLGLSLVVLSGWAGIVSLGQVAFFAIGAAVAGALVTEQGTDLFVALVVAAVVGAAVAAVAGVPAMRLRGLYLAVTTFAFALTTTSYLLDPSRFGWVPEGSRRIERAPLLGGIEASTESQTYYLALAVLALVVAGLAGVRRSRFGRALLALRDNERAAQAYGVDAARAQLAAFALSGGIAALAGALFVHHERAFDGSSYAPIENLAVFTMVVVGGMSTATGAVLGALFLLGGRWFLDTDWQFLASGVGVLLVLLLAPGGLAGLLARARDTWLRAVARRRGLAVPGYSSSPADVAAGAAPLDPTPASGPAAPAGPPGPDGASVQPDDPTAQPDVASTQPGEQPGDVTTPAPASPDLPTSADSGSGPLSTSGPSSPAPGPSSPAGSGAPVPAGARAGAALVAEGIEVGYGGVPVLFGVDLSVGPGEAVALLGTNGAGKSTLLRAVSGLARPSAGRVTVDGDDVTGRPAHAVAARGIALMPGGAGVFPSLTVAENLRVAGWLRRDDRAGLAEGTRRMGELFPILADRSGDQAGNLSGGQQQMLALAMSVLARPRVLLIDELSLGLAPAVVAQVLRFVDDLRAGGTTLVVVEQSVNVALEIADRAVFLERGQVRFAGPAAALLDRPDLLRSVFLGAAASGPARTGSEGPPAAGPAAGSATGAATGPAATGSAATGSAGAPAAEAAGPVLSVAGVSVSFGGVDAVRDVSFDVAPGEIVGVIGPNGAGKTTLFDLVSGFTPSTGGRILLGGRDITTLRAPDRARRGLGRSFQDARLFSSLTVEEAVAVALERWVAVTDPLSAAFHLPNAIDSEHAVRRRVDELIGLLGLGPFRSLYVGELSTGTRRVVDLACLLAHRPRVVLLDEPASGIAQREVEQLAPLIRRIRDRAGAGVVVVEHDIPLVQEVADRVVAMDQGRVVAIGPPGAVLSDPAVLRSYLGDDQAAIQRSGARAPATDRPEPRG